MKEAAFRRPSAAYSVILKLQCESLGPEFCCHIERYILRVRGEAKIIVFMSPPSQGSASCRNWDVVETVIGGTVGDSVCFSSWLVGKMVGP